MGVRSLMRYNCAIAGNNIYRLTGLLDYGQDQPGCSAIYLLTAGSLAQRLNLGNLPVRL